MARIFKKKTNGKPEKISPILKEVKDLYSFMQENNLDGVEYADKGTTVKLARRKPEQVLVPVGGVAPAGGSASQSGAPKGNGYSNTIKSPLMGIFFRGPSPSSPPFVREGEKVNAGQVICLIEAMKVFTEIKAEFNCKIVKVLSDDGKPVKPGQELFAIEKI
ncbi:MAG: biotin carboxyl carrier domain-containing protein [Elusimicrobiaceae bacterium]|nr:biotin carboxyl carrier domain-containing protein [Elusimicrobiaceae bacterium]MBT3955418.1 biotin carboxyl carrier domain-containing protein [Elusimicrobiaceae bacterium]MBT4007695.1 biotin carboxyl carrier domain-containing protein [Elusimicrobiaceae bacterium]MBT4402441.1 biotin carboxyl carrier domain-containing protein [Elusimicrobiaceae bacterium]MBT4439849.1 biotin carboxyl carrier domain-containing protein [Elusimicrobiaceae bacterium]